MIYESKFNLEPAIVTNRVDFMNDMYLSPWLVELMYDYLAERNGDKLRYKFWVERSSRICASFLEALNEKDRDRIVNTKYDISQVGNIFALNEIPRVIEFLLDTEALNEKDRYRIVNLKCDIARVGNIFALTGIRSVIEIPLDTETENA